MSVSKENRDWVLCVWLSAVVLFNGNLAPGNGNGLEDLMIVTPACTGNIAKFRFFRHRGTSFVTKSQCRRPNNKVDLGRLSCINLVQCWKA